MASLPNELFFLMLPHSPTHPEERAEGPLLEGWATP
jgi:hypothetical protein